MNKELSALRIMVVDDDVDVRFATRSLLRSFGHVVEEAASGEQGLARILVSRPDVSLIDLTMEGLDGYQLVRQLRATPDGASLRLVALTGSADPADRERSLSAGFDDYLVKPVGELELLQVLACMARPLTPS